MKLIFTTIFAVSIFFSAKSQVCASLDSWSLVSDNGDGTCTYSMSIIVNSGNGATGTATFSIGSTTVHTELNCVCNPTTITFPVTVNCGSTITIDVVYDAPGVGNNCTGSTGPIVLPVEWLDVSVRNDGNANIISWSTLMEINNDKFIVQHARDGFEFDVIGEVKGAYYSLEQLDYFFTHDNPQSGTNYYRIKQMDFGSDHSYSDIVSIENRFVKKIYVYPNPFDEIVNIEVDFLDAWEITDIFGKAIATGNSGQIQTGRLKAGTYFLQVWSASRYYVVAIIKW